MIKEFVKGIPIIGALSVKLWRLVHGGNQFIGSKRYWEERYATGGNSGAGSYGRLAFFKAEVINQFVKQNKVSSVIEFGCGDGHQLSLAQYPSYVGFDVSITAVEMCRQKFAGDTTKAFFVYNASYRVEEYDQADLALSLDVIYHLVEDDVYEKYMYDLFRSARTHVIIYASNEEEEQRYHERKRNFTSWIKKSTSGWDLVEQIRNPYPYDSANPDHTSQADFLFTRNRSSKW